MERKRPKQSSKGQPFFLPYFHNIKNAHVDALPTFAVHCSISSKSSKSWITVAFKRSFYILTRCFYMTVMKTISALVYIYNTIVNWISIRFCETDHLPLLIISWYFYFPASFRNCINCVHCDDHFFVFIPFPQFIYDLFHISLTLISFTGIYEPTIGLLSTSVAS